MVVEVTDGRFQDRTSVYIELIDMNDNDPRFSEDIYFIRDGIVEEDPNVSTSNRKFLVRVCKLWELNRYLSGDITAMRKSAYVCVYVGILQVSATDDDVDRANNIEYDLSGSYSDYFQIERDTGMPCHLSILLSLHPILNLSLSMQSILFCVYIAVYYAVTIFDQVMCIL